jgi:hypothetical protein
MLRTRETNKEVKVTVQVREDGGCAKAAISCTQKKL